MGMYQYLRSVTIEELKIICTCPRDEVTALLWNREGFIGNYLELNKAWGGLHFLLTGKGLEDTYSVTSPLEWVTLGNHSVGGEDDSNFGNLVPDTWMGVRYLLPDEVRQVSEVLSKVSYEHLAVNYAPQVMDEKDVYPSDSELKMWQRDGDRGLSWILPYFSNVVSFYQQAASEGKVMLMYMPF
jgi:Domain of unknown function (DUF1877)